jgi:TetR/AcrR family transcriptional regulator, cholesterol catabolism regulator
VETLATKKVSIVLRPIMEVKERMLVKAHELFNRYGIRSVSMDDIAAQLGMSKKTLYQYYADKEELVREVILAILEANKERCLADRKRADNAIHELFLAFDMVREMFSRMNPVIIFDLEKYHPQVFKKFHEHKYTFLYQMIKNNLEKGVKEELYRDDLDVDILSRFRIESVMLAFNSEIFPNNRTHLVYIEEQLLDLFVYGISTQKGLKLIHKYKNQRTKK